MSTSATAERGIRFLLVCGFAPLLFLVILLIQSTLRPHYDPLHHFGSELSLGEWGWVQIVNFVVCGLATIIFALGVRRAIPEGRGSVAIPTLTGMVGLSLVIAGVFVTDPLAGFPPGVEAPAEPTLHGRVHDLNFPFFLIVLTAAIIAAGYRSAEQPGERAWTLLTIAVGIFTAVTLMAAASRFDANTLSGTYHGLWQRISFALGFGWYALYAARLLRAHSGKTRSQNKSAAELESHR